MNNIKIYLTIKLILMLNLINSFEWSNYLIDQKTKLDASNKRLTNLNGLIVSENFQSVTFIDFSYNQLKNINQIRLFRKTLRTLYLEYLTD